MLANLTGSVQQGHAWVLIQMPDSSMYGPTLYTPITINPGFTTYPTLLQNIPAFAPAGTYRLIGQLGGYYQGIVVAEDSFEFVKGGVAQDGVTNWDASANNQSQR